MKASDWVCKTCGGPRLKTSAHYLCCERGCGKLIPAPKPASLPSARRYDSRRFTIKGESDYWRRIAGSSKASLDSKPELGVVVARATSGMASSSSGEAAAQVK